MLINFKFSLYLWMLNPIFRMAALLLFCVLFQQNLVECSNGNSGALMANMVDAIADLEAQNDFLVEEALELARAQARR